MGAGKFWGSMLVLFACWHLIFYVAEPCFQGVQMTEVEVSSLAAIKHYIILSDRMLFGHKSQNTFEYTFSN